MDSAVFPISSDQLYTIAPYTLPSHRQLRYDGDGIALDIDSLNCQDRRIIELIYQRLNELLVLLHEHRDKPDETIQQLRDYGASVNWGDLMYQVRGLSSSKTDDPIRAQVFHDLRGGGLMALVIYLQMIGMGIVQSDDMHRMFNLTRDQLKIMRNSVRGIDPEAFERDRQRNLHHVDLLIEKWGSGEGHRIHDSSTAVLVDSQFHGWVSERCLEFSALDRVIYNLINNATIHSTDGRVYLSILPLGNKPENVRFSIFNQISKEQRARIIGRFPNGPGQLFHGGFTTGGSGLGMRICTDFICNAYGLPSVEQALNKGYLGVRFIDDYFIAWFHWPVIVE